MIKVISIAVMVMTTGADSTKVLDMVKENRSSPMAVSISEIGTKIRLLEMGNSAVTVS